MSELCVTFSCYSPEQQINLWPVRRPQCKIPCPSRLTILETRNTCHCGFMGKICWLQGWGLSDDFSQDSHYRRSGALCLRKRMAHNERRKDYKKTVTHHVYANENSGKFVARDSKELCHVNLICRWLVMLCIDLLQGDYQICLINYDTNVMAPKNWNRTPLGTMGK